MNQKAARDILLIAMIGGAYYLLHSSLVGLAAAVALPDGYVAFAQDHSTLALILFAIVTTVPAAALAAVPAGLLVARVTRDRAVLWAVAIVIGVTLYYAILTDLGGGFLQSLKVVALPSSVINIPMTIAWWTFLPTSAAVFAWRFPKNR